MNTTLKYPQGKRTDFLNSMKGLMIALILTLTASTSYAQTTADSYVDINAASGGDGSSWASAYDDLQTAINNGEIGDVIFVKKGEYLLTAAITPKEGMEIYGSFTGAETTLAERDLSNFSNDASNATILKSNGNQRVITINYPPVDPSPNTLDGLVITGGGNIDQGGGIYVLNASPTLRNLIITGNTANQGGSGQGGGIYIVNCSPILINVILSENQATNGGGMYSTSSTPVLTNVTVARNNAFVGGGVSFVAASNAKLNNTIIFGNTASITPDILVESSAPDAKYSLIQGFHLSGNLDGTAYNEADVFADPDNGDYTLKNTSPAINAGSNDLYTNAGGDLAADVDLAGNVRLYDGPPADDVIDVGAYELQRIRKEPTSPGANNILYVNKNVKDSNESGDSWENAITELADAMVWAKENYDNAWETTPLKIYVATGTYKPMYSPEDGAKFGTDQGRDNSFSMVKNVQLYGGFDPDNGINDLTDTRILPSSGNTGTILSGDVDGDDESDFANNSENSIRVMVSSGDMGTALLNGFTITGANGENNNNITVNGNPIYQCSGAGVYNSISSPLYENLLLYGNFNTESGGGMFSYQSSPIVRNSVFRNNKAKDGGAMANQDQSSPVLSNVLFIDNQASTSGGAIYNVDSSTPTFVNITVVGNTDTGEGDGIYNENNAIPSLKNSIVWDDVFGAYTPQNSLIKGTTTTEEGNIDATALTDTDIFTDLANGDYSLVQTSPAVNAGSNSFYTSAGGDLANDVDLAGNPRLYDGVASTDHIDMGAYENVDPEFASETTANFAENATGTAYTAVVQSINVMTYSLGTALDEALFDLVANTGVVTFKATPDFESPIDADASNTYVINVIASDGTHSLNQEVTITVTDVDEITPSVMISSMATAPVSAAFEVSIVFSEVVTGFTIEDLTLSNVEASGFLGTGDTYSVTLTPLAHGTVTVAIAAGSATDAAGNGNSEGTFSIDANMPVALSVDNDRGGQLHIYPNPSSEYIRISSDRFVHTYSLLDIKGRLLKQITATDQAIAIDDLEAGIYFIHAIGERSTVTKFIKK
ncbi:Ig-like domain-containing protein [Reichenbachiella carrageenanivorans]|uniref:Ig-like domain-containing protein n=1 Tax=Reichenbachiella carrageenanivorans TaxID=2979869 RepID=A0ABY6D1T2_9BACT|nr:Ig-like domain-containing protein [Reichenbachiella carrageenanivorans]UXX79884.1 Ig-like domain-containing protein [Reichenbachiella carrageenanivorans]